MEWKRVWDYGEERQYHGNLQGGYLGGGQYSIGIDESVVSGNIDIGDLFSFGEYTKTVEDCIVENISYDSDMNATITAFMYSDDVYTLDTIPVFVSNINSVGSSKPESRHLHLW